MKETQEQHEKRSAALMRSLTNQAPGPTQQERMEQVRNFAKKYAEALMSFTDASREQSLAITKLEESVMWAIKGIALEENQV